MSIEAKIGDVFGVPLDDGSFGAGIVAGKWKSELYLVIFEERFASVEEIAKASLDDLTPIFASSSLDAKIWHGHWPIIKSNVDVATVMFPMYKVEEPAGTVAESFDRELRIQINADCAQYLLYRKTVAPVRLENALKAHHGFKEWNSAYDELAYEKVVSSRSVLSFTRHD